MPLSELNFVSDDLVLLYENHKKAKLGPEGSKINPVHSDFRFYNQYSWDLFKSQSEMQTSLFTVEFSLGFVISNNGQSVIARNKTGYFYNPSDKYPGKKKIKLGTSYHKSFMNMLGDRKISDDLIYQIRENLNKQIYSFSSDIEKSEFIKNLLNKAVQNIETLQPPKVLNSDAYELWEMTHKTLREIFEQINETNYLKLLNIE